ncbi:MAG: alanine--tRNA ligase [Chloroflexota bacterium]|nr:alanine--tRNA ligase [Chloroflexota bacterium]
MKIAPPRTASDVRQAFLDFFEEYGHTHVASAPLVPQGDDTLLFVNAGMVQFKDTFLGLEKRPYDRAASSQKCMRVSGKHNDLEEVGPSPRHHTFFEMLGNFSFGDYFKRDAILFAWQCLTRVFAIPEDRLVITVFKDDDDALAVWRDEIGIPLDRIMRMGEKTNFWSMGDTGPTGPTSELHYDQGADACTCGDPKCSVALDNECERWLEVWNLVFMQYNQHADGTRTPLAQHGVDTGMGFERLVSILQGVDNNYDTDVFQPIMRRVQEMLRHSDQQMQAETVAYRVIADHSRAITFLIADGVLPGNEGRNYILRLVLRRAARFGRLLGFKEPFLSDVSQVVIDTMGGVYPEIVERSQFILDTIRYEEERFLRTLDVGLSLVDNLVQQLTEQGETTMPGDEVFKLWDTFGFPLDLTRDIAEESGLTIDMVGYQKALEKQRRRARAAAHFGAAEGEDLSVYVQALDRLPDGGVDHLYLLDTQLPAEVAGIVADGVLVDQVEAGQEVEIILSSTPFYVEAGGQVSDTGAISEDCDHPRWQVDVSDTRCPIPGVIVHAGRVARGVVSTGDRAMAAVDLARRADIARNHSATHILHSALHGELGDHARQAGSLVAPDRFRFDFTHPSAVSDEQLQRIEQAVNDAVFRNDPVTARWTTYREALDSGAMALFGEKYGDEVRVVEIGPASDKWSKELCGGTHVRNAGEIGAFHIVSEGSVGSGARRIEAVTGRGAQQYLQERLALLKHTAAILGVPEGEVARRARALVDQASAQQKEITRLQDRLARQEFEGLLNQVVQVDGIDVLAAQVNAANANIMATMTDWFRDQLPSGVVVLGAAINGKPNFIASVTDDLVTKGMHAGKLVKAVAEQVGGGGGGRPTMARAGGTDLAGLQSAIRSVPGLVSEQLSDSQG